MEADVSHEYQEYLNEYFLLRETDSLIRFLDEVEESSCRSADEGAGGDAGGGGAGGGGAGEGEGEREAEWLVEAGLPQLSEAFAAGRVVADAELEPALRSLPLHQAEAVKKRVRTLNHTLRRRPRAHAHAHANGNAQAHPPLARQPRARPRKPDIRDVFKGVENSSTGTRSRSATPDSLDSEQPGDGDGDVEVPTSSPPRLWSCPIPSAPVGRNLTTVTDQTDTLIPHIKEALRRQPNSSLPKNHAMVFRHPGAWGSHKGSLAGDSPEGIEMLYYQSIGTIHLPRPRDRLRSVSDSLSLQLNETLNTQYIGDKSSGNNGNGNFSHGKSNFQKNHVNITRSHSNLHNIAQNETPSLPRVVPKKASLRRSGSHGQLGFEEFCLQNAGGKIFPCHLEENGSLLDPDNVGRTWIEFLGDEDLLRLRPLFWLEVTAIFDSYNITFNKRKPPKHKHKTGNIFGVPLATLLAKDQQIVHEECHVPLVYQKILAHLERTGVREEGILRVAGLQQKVEAVCNVLETDFYRNPVNIDLLLQNVSCHDLAGVLKRLLRELTQPLLTAEYIDLFYQCHGLPERGGIQSRALNMLVLLLPPENRHTLRALFSLLLSIIQHQAVNKMSLHNVAMIIAPSLFTPHYVHPTDKNDLNAQVSLAATCCRLTESMLKEGDKLWVVPGDLISQIRRQKEEERYRRGHKENSRPMRRLLGKKTDLRDQIMRKIDNEVDFQLGIIRVNAPQFQMAELPIKLNPKTTAGDVVLRIVEEATKKADMSNSDLKIARRHHDKRALTELAPNGNLSCILASGYPDMTLQTHFLYEVGGNIAQRQVEQSANMMTVYQENPNTQWILRCHHRNGNNIPVH